MSHLSLTTEFETLHFSQVAQSFDLKFCELCGFQFVRKTPESARVGAKYGPCCAGKVIQRVTENYGTRGKRQSSTFDRADDFAGHSLPNCAARDSLRKAISAIAPQILVVADEDPAPLPLRKSRSAYSAAGDPALDRHSRRRVAPRKTGQPASVAGRIPQNARHVCGNKQLFKTRALAELAAKHTRRAHHGAKNPPQPWLCPILIQGKKHFHVGGKPEGSPRKVNK